MVDPLWLVAGTLAGAFLPPAVYTAWVRSTERFHREPWRNLARAFAWGATGGVLLALVLELVLGVRPDAAGAAPLAVLATAVIVAPLVEEFTKGFGLRWIHDRHPEPEDGFIYGAAAGFGFAATENLVYAAMAYSQAGVAGLAGSLVLRTLSSALLHGTASGVLGYGYWRVRYGRAGSGTLVGAYLGAVALHAGFNLGASLALEVTVLLAIALAMAAFWWLRGQVRRMDRASQQPLAP